MAETHSQDLLSEIANRIPSERLLTYTRLWQFENWLRIMVYVESRARYGDSWVSHLKGQNRSAYKNDKKLSHMPTRETLPTSYMQLSDLLSSISSNWYLFKPYLPPKNIWDAKLSELNQIRHRIAHFRLGHKHDLDRVELLLRDVDKGFWRFCTSYNSSFPVFPQSKDVVIKKFLHLDPFPWSEVEPNGWARLGSADPNLIVSITFEVIRRQWLNSTRPSQVAGKYGYLYDVTLGARNGRRFDYPRFLEYTRLIHPRLCHICLDSLEGRIRVTIPTILGKAVIIKIVESLIEVARSCLRHGRESVGFEQLSEQGHTNHQMLMVDSLAEQWPEYVLGPSNPLTFLDPNMPCSFFDVK